MSEVARPLAATLIHEAARHSGNTLYYAAIPARDTATAVAGALAAAVAAYKMGYGRLPR